MTLQKLKLHMKSDNYVYHYENKYKVLEIVKIGMHDYAVVDSYPMTLVKVDELKELEETSNYLRNKDLLKQIEKLTKEKDRLIMQMRVETFRRLKQDLLLKAAITDDRILLQTAMHAANKLQEIINSIDLDKLLNENADTKN